MNTLEYYQSLDEETIKDDIENLGVATRQEFFDLIIQDPLHYISILEYYKSDDKPQFPIIVSRKLNNLFIKYQLDTQYKWIEIGFIDSDITDVDSLNEFKTSVKFNKKHYMDLCKAQRLDEMTLGKSKITEILDSKQEPASTLVSTVQSVLPSIPRLNQLFNKYVDGVKGGDLRSGLNYMELKKHVDELDSDTILTFMLCQHHVLSTTP